MIRVDEPAPKWSTFSVNFVRGRSTARLASEKFTTNCPFRYTRSPASPRSTTSRKSPVPISRPSGIFPAGKVFQLPPPAFDARATWDESAGTGFAGRTGTGVVVGADAAWVVWVAATVGAAAAAICAGVAAGTFCAVGAEATVIGVEVGTLGF